MVDPTDQWLRQIEYALDDVRKRREAMRVVVRVETEIELVVGGGSNRAIDHAMHELRGLALYANHGATHLKDLDHRHITVVETVDPLSQPRRRGR